jgi:hypothetical protein
MEKLNYETIKTYSSLLRTGACLFELLKLHFVILNRLEHNEFK